MKTKKLKIVIPFLLLIPICVVLLGAGCEKDENLWEISPDSKSAVIQKEVDGIEFKFCLLNEKGEPATVFKEGENFSLFFSIANNRDEKLYFYPSYAYSNENEFCKIFNSSGQDIGKPFLFSGVDKIGIGAYPLFDSENVCVFEQKWLDYRDSTWRWKYGYFESAKQGILMKGSYYTGFNQRFEFSGDTHFYTDTINFLINFKIK
jgi:hypothetical protein